MGTQVRPQPAFEDVTDPGTRHDYPRRSNREDRHNAQPRVEQGQRDREPHAERVDRPRPGDEEPAAGLEAITPPEPAHPFAQAGGHLDHPPPVARIPQDDLSHEVARYPYPPTSRT
jgi:hypothetical protein